MSYTHIHITLFEDNLNVNTMMHVITLLLYHKIQITYPSTSTPWQLAGNKPEPSSAKQY